MALVKSALKFLAFTYDATVNGGSLGPHTESGLFLPPRCFVSGFGIVDIGFTGVAGGAYGIGIAGSPGLIFSLTDFTLLTTNTVIMITNTWRPAGGQVTNDIANQVALTGKVTMNIFYTQLP